MKPSSSTNELWDRGLTLFTFSRGEPMRKACRVSVLWASWGCVGAIRHPQDSLRSNRHIEFLNFAGTSNAARMLPCP